MAYTEISVGVIESLKQLILCNRSEEDNAEAMVQHFLPFVDHPNYRVLLSIVRLPPGDFEFFGAFLDAKAVGDTKLNKSAIAHAFARNTGLLDRYSSFVMDRVADATAYPLLLEFWKTTVKEALIILRSRNFSSEKIAQILVPSIARGFTARAQEMTLAVVQTLCSSFSLSDEMLRAIMEHIARHWNNGNSNENLKCVAIIAALCDDIVALPRLVYEAVRKSNDAKMAVCSNPKFGACFLLARLNEDPLDEALGSTLQIAKEAHLSEYHVTLILHAQFHQWRRTNNEEALLSLRALIKWFAIVNDITSVISGVGDAAARDALTEIAEEQSPHNTPSLNRKRKLSDSCVKLLQLSDLPEINFQSFFDDNEVILQYLSAVDMSAMKKTDFSIQELLKLLSSPTLQVTLLLRVILKVDSSVNTAIEAIDNLKIIIKSKFPVPQDFQLIIPFMILALTSPSNNVRSGITSLLSTLNQQFSDQTLNHLNFFGAKDFHRNSNSLTWLTFKEAGIFLNQNIDPFLSDFQLDSNFIIKHFGRIVRFVGQDGKRGHQSTAILNFLCSHALYCPNQDIQYTLIEFLNSLEITSTISAAAHKTALLLPLLKDRSSPSNYQALSKDQLQTLFSIVGKGSSNESLYCILQCLQIDSSDLVGVAATQLKRIWPSLPLISLDSIAPQLFNIALSRNMTSSKAAQRVLLSQKLPTNFFLSLLTDITISTPVSTPDVNDRSRQSTSSSESHGNVAFSIKESVRSLTLLLEILESSATLEMGVLLPTLSQILSQVLAVESSSNIQVLYVKQLILSCILSIIQQDENAPFDVKSIRLDSLITCIRTSQSSHISNRALPILSFIANRAPETVLHHIMPIFTFMGNNLSRKDDRATAIIIETTLHSIVPPLLDASKARRSISTIQMLQSFSNSIAHIPQHRRLPLFRTLLNTIGRGESDLLLLLALCKNTDMPDELMSESKELAVYLLSDLGCGTLLQTLKDVLDFSMTKLLEDQVPNTLPKIFGVLYEKYDYSNIQRAQSRAMMLLVQAISNPAIQSTIRQADMKPDSPIRETLAKILEWLLELQQLRSINGFRIPSLKLLRVVLSLLPFTFFVSIAKQFLDQADEKLIISTLEAATTEVKRSNSDLDENQQATSRLVQSVLPILNGSPRTHVALIVYRFLSLTGEKYGKSCVSVFQSHYGIFLADGGLSHPAEKVKIEALGFLTSMQSVLGPRVIAHLPSIVQILVTQYSQVNLTREVDLASWQLFSKLVRRIPNFMTSYYPRIFEVLLLSATKFRHERNGVGREKFITSVSKKGNHESSITACFGLQENAAELGPTVKLDLEFPVICLTTFVGAAGTASVAS